MLTKEHPRLITTEQFLQLIYDKESTKLSFLQWLEQAREALWIEEYDLIHFHTFIDRRSTVRICHKYLITVLKEPDWNGSVHAARLLDLYDCHTCVNAITQVYEKGIFVPSGNLFCPGQKLTEAEAVTIAERLFDVRLRDPMDSPDTSVNNRITLQDYMVFAGSHDRQTYHLIDLRSSSEREHNSVGNTNLLTEISRCYKLSDLIENPDCLYAGKEEPIFLYCEHGSLSDLACAFLQDHGYTSVYSFALNE